MISPPGIINRIKYYFILNRTKLSTSGVYQIFYFIYRRYNGILTRYYSLGQKNVHCPVCGYTGRKYMKKGICPQCWSAARNRLLALYIKNVKKLPQNSRILDIAPDIPTSYIFDRRFYRNCVSIDLDSPAADIYMDLTNLGIKNGVFEFIVCYHVLEHIKDDTKAIQELYRILKPEGTAILQVPLSAANDHTFEFDKYNSTNRAMNLELYGHPTHVRRYGKVDYVEKLKSSGFDVLMDTYVNSFSEHEVMSYGLDKNEVLFVCGKKEIT
jgi:SAM-dependent methyltransferase